MKQELIIVSEFLKESGAPTGALVSDLAKFLSQNGHSVKTVAVDRMYHPGGLRPQRFLNMVEIFFKLIGAFFGHMVKNGGKGSNVCVLVTTSPPLFHIVTLFLAKLASFPVVLWFMDAHPEIELRFLERNLGKLESGYTD